ncbi:hypothetical protein [Pseudoalteromonas spongiae]|uniref:hypothetical protein n=1 Tax=Pseudoalteromonas spongiae TaxID=298657 RepID=UPI000C2CF4D4|nr:hypothetical protein [Pseudoalteromonas spongiae]
MSENAVEISEVQSQQLLDGIVEVCDELGLEPTQILDGLSRSLLSAANAFGTKELTVSIEGVGEVKMTLSN